MLWSSTSRHLREPTIHDNWICTEYRFIWTLIGILYLTGPVMLVKTFWWYSTLVTRRLKFASSEDNCFSPRFMKLGISALIPISSRRLPKTAVNDKDVLFVHPVLDILHICFEQMGENRSFIILSVCQVWTNCSKKIASCCDNHHYLNQWSSLVKTIRPSLELKVVAFFKI